MGSSRTTHQLAPVALLRAAAFPIGKLTGFGDAELAERALAATDGDSDPEFARAHAEVVERERNQLRRETVCDTRFMRALTIANPQLARRAAAFDSVRSSTARARRLQGALFRHLARAVGRTEPADLWAGVAMTDWSAATVVEERAEVVLVHPDLRPFQCLLRALSRRPPYVWSERWRANATLSRQDDGRWRYSARLADGRVVDRVTEPNALADVLFPALSNEPVVLSAMATDLVGPSGLDRATLAAVLESYVGAGVLVGGLDLPARFATPWEAIDRAGARLTGADGEAWRDAVATLRRQCVDLEERLLGMTSEQLADAVDAAEVTLLALAERLDVAVTPARSVLRCDLRLGLDVHLGPDVRGRVVTALAAYEDPTRHGGGGRALRQALGATVRAQIGPGRPVAEVAVAYRSSRLRAGGAEGLSANPPWAEPPGPDGVDAAPVGCLLVGLEEAPEGGLSLTLRGVFDEVSPLYGRFAPLWGSVVPVPQDRLYHWLRQQLQQLEHDGDLRIAELAGPCEANPNALAAPRLVVDSFELWGTTEAGCGLVGAVMRTDPTSGSPVVRVPGEPRDVVLFSFVSADVARGDRISELLLASSCRVAPAPSFEALTLAVGVEPAEAGPTPRVVLDGGARVGSRRTVLRGEGLQRLLGTVGHAQYVRWQQLAAENRWPTLVRVRVPGEHALLMPTTSPLAVDAVLSRVPASTTTVVVEDADGVPWLTDRTGARYVSELAAPFRREPHVWSARSPAGI